MRVIGAIPKRGTKEYNEYLIRLEAYEPNNQQIRDAELFNNKLNQEDYERRN